MPKKILLRQRRDFWSKNMDNMQPTFTMRPVRYEDGSYGVEATITGLKSEQQAEAAMLHMQRLFCAEEMQEQ